MKLSEKQIKWYRRLRAAMLLLVTVGGVVAGAQPDFLPVIVPKVAGFVAAVAGGVVTWAASQLPGKGE